MAEYVHLVAPLDILESPIRLGLHAMSDTEPIDYIVSCLSPVTEDRLMPLVKKGLHKMEKEELINSAKEIIDRQTKESVKPTPQDNFDSRSGQSMSSDTQIRNEVNGQSGTPRYCRISVIEKFDPCIDLESFREKNSEMHNSSELPEEIFKGDNKNLPTEANDNHFEGVELRKKKSNPLQDGQDESLVQEMKTVASTNVDQSEEKSPSLRTRSRNVKRLQANSDESQEAVPGKVSSQTTRHTHIPPHSNEPPLIPDETDAIAPIIDNEHQAYEREQKPRQGKAEVRGAIVLPTYALKERKGHLKALDSLVISAIVIGGPVVMSGYRRRSRTNSDSTENDNNPWFCYPQNIHLEQEGDICTFKVMDGETVVWSVKFHADNLEENVHGFKFKPYMDSPDGVTPKMRPNPTGKNRKRRPSEMFYVVQVPEDQICVCKTIFNKMRKSIGKVMRI